MKNYIKKFNESKESGIYDLNSVIKRTNQIISEYKKHKGKESIEVRYYEILVRYLLIEHKYQEEVKKAGKPIYHYFMYKLPEFGNEYFQFLYNPHNPVRFALETFDSIESVRKELNR
jgi:hypothetical protein